MPANIGQGEAVLSLEYRAFPHAAEPGLSSQPEKPITRSTLAKKTLWHRIKNLCCQIGFLKYMMVITGIILITMIITALVIYHRLNRPRSQPLPPSQAPTSPPKTRISLSWLTPRPLNVATWPTKAAGPTSQLVFHNNPPMSCSNVTLSHSIAFFSRQFYQVNDTTE